MKESLVDKALRNKESHDENSWESGRYDFLTGLPGVTLYFSLEDLGRRKNRENGLSSAVVFFNLLGMKDYNRKHGFSEGDNLILSISRILVKYFGKECCGRFVADHFSAFAKAEGIEDILRAVFAEVKEANGSKAPPLVAGIYLDEIEYVNASVACDRAKLAADQLRHSSVSAFYYFDEYMLERENRRQYIIDNLDKAIENRWIQPFFQPIFRVVNNQVSDEECLARWIDPEKGIICPGEFIPVLEETGMIYKLDLCIVEQALERMNRFMSQNLAVVPASVNISRSDFDACDIVEEIRRRVDSAGIERNRLHIELTESVIGSDFTFIKKQVERFRELGFQVWMDDFGSGYSSLDVLQNIKFDLIKMDMRFIQQYGKQESSEVILSEILKMILGLRTDALCEGVETEAQLEFLREIGCPKVQGYFFTEPVSETEIVRRYESGFRFEMENPQEREYYSRISNFNLYDPASVNGREDDKLAHYLDSIPVVIFEVGERCIKLLRCNRSGRRFMQNFTENPKQDTELLISGHPGFVDSINQDANFQEWTRISDRLENGSMVESFVRWIAYNPMTNRKAAAIIILDIGTKDK